MGLSSVVSPALIRFLLSAIQELAVLLKDVGPPKGTQFDLKQATGFEALSFVPMNTLLLIKEKELKSQRLHDAQRSFAAHSEGIDYTSAHQSPAKLASRAS